jgi:hypothetical protein
VVRASGRAQGEVTSSALVHLKLCSGAQRSAVARITYGRDVLSKQPKSLGWMPFPQHLITFVVAEQIVSRLQVQEYPARIPVCNADRESCRSRCVGFPAAVLSSCTKCKSC